MSANADLMDEAIGIALILDRLSQHSYQIAAARLSSLRDDLSALIVMRDPTSPRYEANRRTRLEALIEEAEAAISVAYSDIASRIQRDLLDAETLVQDSLSEKLALLLVIKGLSRRMDREGLVVLRDATLIAGVTTRDWLARQSGDLRFRVRAALTGAMTARKLGSPPSASDLVGTLRSTAPGSVFSAIPSHVESLIVSAHHAVANSVRLETAVRHPELFSALVHISILDGRTTRTCRSRANRRWTLDGVPLGHGLPFLRPPLHYRCRSHLYPVLHAFDDLPARIQRRVKRGDFSGSAPREPDLEDWLEENGRSRDAGPLDYRAARRELGI